MKAAIKNIDLLQAVNRGLLNLNTSEVEVRPVPFTAWFKLKRRNDVLTTDMDMLLEGVLWQDGDGGGEG